MSTKICFKDTLLYPANILLFYTSCIGYFSIVKSLSLLVSLVHI